MDVVEKSWEVQKDIEERVKKIGKGKYGRVIKMARRPSTEEYVKIIQITALGLVAIGGLGFLIYWLMTYLPGYFT
ncbi:protein translocase SEC61 complex subunit gamma [Methanomassiliicoccus luminyensis]|jgi:protein transport protein SEC61 subunit gamma-like protein|uniref:protein translocase SEC61 complex subunit gamma n=1 Tax=Methanomassiliicoccus luminyensis TaxID=1080712 RepID=UPI0004753877|nr:protein translocase SEC61 complex subunit gamma [Methanomassiliicoccus luminyensis]